MPHKFNQLKDEYQDSDCVWFLVDVKYRIVDFNKKAAHNSVAFHNKEISPGQSILDYARDTKNKIDSDFIECFGRAAAGKKIEHKQRISFSSANINAKSIFTPIVEGKEVNLISITVEYTDDNNS
jgi:hypothetical protein